jgi:hypothetical protein
MDAYNKQLMAKIDQLAAQADALPEGEQRQQLVEQIAALNIASTLHSED